MMVYLRTTGNGIDSTKVTRNAFLKFGSVYGTLCKFVLKASYNRKLTHLSIFEFREKELKCTRVPFHAVRADLDALDER